MVTNLEQHDDLTLPGVDAPLVLPDLVDADSMLPGSCAYTGFHYGGVKGEVFGYPYGKGRGLEVVIHCSREEFYIDAELIDTYYSEAADRSSDEPLQRIIMDVLL